MPETFQSVLIGGAAGFLSAIVTHFSTRANLRLDLADFVPSRPFS